MRVPNLEARKERKKKGHIGKKKMVGKKNVANFLFLHLMWKTKSKSDGWSDSEKKERNHGR